MPGTEGGFREIVPQVICTPSFSIGSKGYIGTGIQWHIYKDWDYDPVADTWTKMADLGDGAIWRPGFSSVLGAHRNWRW
jgi:hypothetical protein